MNIPEKMLAVKLEKPGGPLITRSVQVPKPKQGEVVIKMAAAPINPSDITRIKGISGEQELLSFIPGIEGSGKIVAEGKGLLPRLWLGKRVACSAIHPESGTWAEYMVTSASYCFPISKTISDDQGSMLLVNPMTAVAFFDIAAHEKHKAIVNSAAAGALGRMIRILGNKKNIPVINVVRNVLQAEMLVKEGAEYVLINSDVDFAEKLKVLTHELNATLALDPISGNYTRQLLEALPYRGTVLVYGQLSGIDQGTSLRPLVLENKKLHGFYLGNWMKGVNLIKTALNLYMIRHLFKNEIKVTVQEGFPWRKHSWQWIPI